MSKSRLKTQQAAKADSKAIAHFLIGIPGSGKSTFAKLLSSLGNCEIISTDEIREELYGDATIQGEWQSIEAIILNRICTEFSLGRSIIYDATNFKRSFRMDFLLKVNTLLAQWELPQPHWLGWYLKTPLETCIQRNQQRQRQVPQSIIESMYKLLQDFPPITGEGFAAVNQINVNSPQFSPHQIVQLIADVPRQIINFQNRHANITPHRYSHLLDFERLMYLLFLIINYPGIGEFHLTQPQLLENILGSVPNTNSINDCNTSLDKDKDAMNRVSTSRILLANWYNFTNSVAEITAIMAKLRGTVYAKEDAIAADLEWLETEGIIHATFSVSNKNTPEFANYKTTSLSGVHSYSDKEVFGRLIGTIRFILHYPFLANIGGGSLETLTQSLAQAGVIYNPKSEKATIRKDIEKVLKPYKILSDFPMRNGYFAGTGILSKTELIKVFDIIQSQANSLNDPQALAIYETFKQRLLQTHTIENTEKF